MKVPYSYFRRISRKLYWTSQDSVEIYKVEASTDDGKTWETIYLGVDHQFLFRHTRVLYPFLRFIQSLSL